MAAVVTQKQKQQQQPLSTSDKGSLLRRGSQAKKPLKEKIVQIYEAFFRVWLMLSGIYCGTWALMLLCNLVELWYGNCPLAYVGSLWVSLCKCISDSHNSDWFV